MASLDAISNVPPFPAGYRACGLLLPLTSLPSPYGIGDLGPGADLFRGVQEAVGALPFLAEDLGLITADAVRLRERDDIPGTRIVQFAFDGNPQNPYLPENYPVNTVVYTGTHDNPTTREWFEAIDEHERRRVWQYLRGPGGEAREIAGEMMRLAWSSRAALAIAPLSGCAKPRAGRPDECARYRRRKLAVACFASHAGPDSHRATGIYPPSELARPQMGRPGTRG